MRDNAANARATLDAWRERGDDRLDPVRFHRMDALERRVAGHDDEVRRHLGARLAELISAYADDIDTAAQNGESAAQPQATPGGGLGALLAHIAARRDGASVSATPAALDDIRAVWTRLRAERQMRQSLEDSAEDAGPLNSARLVHRALTLMRDVSPDYLQQFLSYVDGLMWLEQIGAGASTAESEPRITGNGKRAKPRKR